MQKHALKSTRLLIVEDEGDTLKNLIIALKPLVGELFAAENGLDAYDLFLKNSPDIVLTDIRLPGMNGIELSSYIKNHNINCFIIAMTAFSQDDFLSSALDAGVSLYIKKPIDMDELIFALESTANRLRMGELHLGEFVFRNGSLYKEGEEIFFSNKEGMVVKTLIKNLGKIVPHEELEDLLELSRSALRNHISNINKKTHDAFIKNLSGIGYMIAHHKI